MGLADEIGYSPAMMKLSLLAAALILTACSADTPPERKRDAPASSAKPVPAAKTETTSPAKAKSVEEKTGLLDFTYAWPAEAASIPPLNKRLEAEMADARTDALANAREDKASRTDENFPFNPHFYSKKWEMTGDNAALLSLLAQESFFTGGAHPNYVYDAILWDKKDGKAIDWKDLFQDSANALALLTPDFCEKLDAQRAEKRQEPLPLHPTNDWMTECPPLDKEVVVPVDANKDGRFELFRVMLPPYEAGPYAEGDYQVGLPVTPPIRALVKPAYAGAF